MTSEQVREYAKNIHDEFKIIIIVMAMAMAMGFFWSISFCK